MRRTREQYATKLEYQMADIKEALAAAFSMGNWKGVIKYAEQAMALEPKLYDATVPTVRSPKRVRREWYSAPFGSRAGDVFGRGGKWKR